LANAREFGTRTRTKPPLLPTTTWARRKGELIGNDLILARLLKNSRIKKLFFDLSPNKKGGIASKLERF